MLGSIIVVPSLENLTMPSSTTILILASLLLYMLIIFILRKRHDRFLNETPYPRTESEAHPFTLRYIYGDFHFIAVKSLEFGLFKTYAIPSISKILAGTGELVDRCPRRYDDTDLLIREFLEHMPNSLRARRALERMNFIHSRYRITNVDYLYVLCIFIVEPIRWVRRFGYRLPHPKETFAMHLRWSAIGEKMGIRDIPATYEDAEAYLDAYEEKYMVFANTNARLAKSTVSLFLSKVPTPLHPLCLPVVYALCPPRLCTAMGFPTPSPLLVTALELLLRVSGLFVRYLLPPRMTPKTRTTPLPLDVPVGDTLCPLFHPYEKTYANGYKIEELGPVRFLPKCAKGA